SMIGINSLSDICSSRQFDCFSCLIFRTQFNSHTLLADMGRYFGNKITAGIGHIYIDTVGIEKGDFSSILYLVEINSDTTFQFWRTDDVTQISSKNGFIGQSAHRCVTYPGIGITVSDRWCFSKIPRIKIEEMLSRQEISSPAFKTIIFKA